MLPWQPILWQNYLPLALIALAFTQDANNFRSKKERKGKLKTTPG